MKLTFLSKIYEESNKMIDDILAKKSIKGESNGVYNISISIANDEFDNNANTVDFVEGKGIKKSPYRSTKRPKSCNEKLAIKRKKNASRKKKKPQENLVIYA